MLLCLLHIRTGSSWSPVWTLPVAPLRCDLGFFPNSRGNKAVANLRLSEPWALKISLDWLWLFHDPGKNFEKPGG